MKYVITGGAGHISKPLALHLLKAGHEVTVIGRNADNLKELTAQGAKAAIGSVEDVPFLTQAFAGADAVYTMVPPNWGASDWKGYIAQIGKNLAAALKANKTKHVVNLSSIGAHMAEGCGPVSGLFYVEKALNELTDTHVLHLRPGFFYYNFFNNIGMIKHMGIIGGNYSIADKNFVLIDPADIAEAAAERLQKLDFSGKSVVYLASEESGTDEVASVLGQAIGKPDLKWVPFTDEQTMGGMIQNGISEEVAKNYTEMGSAIRSGKMMEEYIKNKPVTFGKTKLNDFAKTFAAAYHAG